VTTVERIHRERGDSSMATKKAKGAKKAKKVAKKKKK
jgi:hypothetical protein